jgi:hypothetical protein
VRFWQDYEGEDTEVLQIDGVLYVKYDALPHHIVQAQLEEFMLLADQMICDELTTFERLA